MFIRLLLTLTIALLLVSCEDNSENSPATNQELPTLPVTEVNPVPAENKLALVCDNGYAITANYHSPDAEGLMTKLSLEISKEGKTEKLDMVPAIAASGAKFETPDQKTSFWEHHDEFTLAINDQDVSVCKESRKQEELSTQSGKTFIVREDNTESASLSHITVIAKGFAAKDLVMELTDKDPISSSFLADINQDGFEELYIVTTSAAADNLGNVYGFASNNDKTISVITQPKISENDLKKGGHFYGYRGSDDFYADENALVRDFPVYQEKDSTDNPTGGRKLVYYHLKAGEPDWQLVIIKSDSVE
ncbi:MAG: MliC family protein [Methylococcales bacterium]